MSRAEPAAALREILRSNLYLTLATADATGVPWPTPVFFAAADDLRSVYWASSPDARHSQNLTARPEVGIVVFDSRVLVGHASAAYLAGTAAEVGPDELEDAARVYGARGHGARFFPPDELSGDADLRLYRADITEHHILVRGGDPVYGRAVDGRLRVDLPG